MGELLPRVNPRSPDVAGALEVRGLEPKVLVRLCFPNVLIRRLDVGARGDDGGFGLKEDIGGATTGVVPHCFAKSFARSSSRSTLIAGRLFFSALPLGTSSSKPPTTWSTSESDRNTHKQNKTRKLTKIHNLNIYSTTQPNKELATNETCI